MPKTASKKEQILKAAFEIIVESGLESFSIRKLSTKSNLSIGVIYHHFADKDEIIHNLLGEYGISMLDWFGAEIATLKDPVQKLDKKIKNSFNVYQKNIALVIILANYITRSFYSKKEKQATAGMLAGYRKTLLKILQSGVDSGTFTIDDPESLATLILGATLGVNLQAGIDQNIETQKAAQIMVDIILSYIRSDS